MIARTFPTFLVALLLALSSSLAADTSSLRASLFTAVDETLRGANQAKASVLAPESYLEAAELYKSAEQMLEKGKNLERIRSNLNEAQALFEQSEKSATLASQVLSNAIEAREDALAAQASEYVKEGWTDAEREFRRAAVALENGSSKKAKKYAGRAETEYRALELSAIKISYLDETRKLIDTALEDKVDRFAPKTLAQAKALLNRAEKGLNENRYDTDEPRLLAKQAHYQARHAVYIAKLVRQIDDSKLSVEDLILSSEEPIIDIASALDLVVEFDEGLQQPKSVVRAEIESLRQDAQELADCRSQLAKIEGEMISLENRLGMQSERLERQEQRKQRLQQLESMFTSEEALVFSKADNVVVRTIGLNFDSGSASIGTQYFGLLKKIQNALRLFPNATVIVEGHTDSFGGDDINLALSEERANAVKAYLEANFPNSGGLKITSVGYGESKPIANNETREGRTKNRRIDMIIVPEN